MNSREIVKRAILFEGVDRMPFEFPERYGSDFYRAGLNPSPDDRPRQGVDEWGAIWENIGGMQLGQVKDFPVKTWKDFENMVIPDITEARRWDSLFGVRQNAGDKFLLGSGISIYERVHFLRGLENTWMDILEESGKLSYLVSVLVEMNLVAIQKYHELGFDGFIFCDDWGLQNRLMISPNAWRKIWKPQYVRIYQAAHEAGLLTFLHSCGYIVDILDDLIEIGLDVIHMDQQENMGLDLLGRRFGGRLTFFAPVDIQKTMAYGTTDEIRAYCRQMVNHLMKNGGGFIPCWYSDPAGAGHRKEAIDAMCDEFLRINADLQSLNLHQTEPISNQ